MVKLFLILSLGLSSVAWAGTTESVPQKIIDQSYELIFHSTLAKSICRHILGGDHEAISLHLGVSEVTAKRIAGRCLRTVRHPWIHPTAPNDIRKLTLNNHKARKYKILRVSQPFPIESWTEPFTNTTVLVTTEEELSQARWVQILAHELAVYFDSKVNPHHPDADNIPELRDIKPIIFTEYDPLVAATNPLPGHALTFLRALQVEYAILTELAHAGRLRLPPDLYVSVDLDLITDRCSFRCIENLVTQVRNTLSPLGLPLLAFAPHFRSLAINYLARRKFFWNREELALSHLALSQLPIEYLRSEFRGNLVDDMRRLFHSELNDPRFESVRKFLDRLWHFEKQALFSAQYPAGRPLLEFLKVPLLSGYNIGLSSGPRVRVRPGVTE